MVCIWLHGAVVSLGQVRVAIGHCELPLCGNWPVCYKLATYRKSVLLFYHPGPLRVDYESHRMRGQGQANMAVYRLGIYTVLLTAAALFLFQPAFAGDGPNRITPSDVAAGQWVDSLLGPEMAQNSQRKPTNSRSHARRRTKQQRAALRGKLVNNPDTSDGTPPFALVDRYGGVVRYIEPVEEVNLEAYLGETVGVRRDTGDILLASQLALPGEGGILLAQNEESIPAGEVVEESSILTENPDFVGGEPIYLDESIDFGGCPDCGYGVGGRCGGVGGRCGGYGCGGRGVLYVRGEYLLWWMEGMDTPQLVIADDNGAFSSPDTIYGGRPILENSRDGGRITVGLWLDECGLWGLETEYFGLETLTETFSAGGNDGQPGPTGLFIGRPFFNTVAFTNGNGVLVPRGPVQEEVDTQRLDGFVTVTSRSKLDSFGIRLRHSLCCAEPCCVGCGSSVGCGSGCGCGVGGGYPLAGPIGNICRLLKRGVRRTDILYGFRYTQLEESLRINENLEVVQNPPNGAPDLGTTFIVNDNFETENEFAGFDLGFITDWQCNRWSLSLLSKVAIGNTRQRATISGNTIIDSGTGPVEFNTGVLTQLYENNGLVVGNIGTYERDEFSMIPELGVTVGYQLTPRIKLVGGYTLIYWSNILRPGDQINLDVNGVLIPSAGAGPGASSVVAGDHPRFTFVQTDAWLQGINFGAELGW
ncbi:MAG: BBP7 family outer membrane beta-barrel protein [Pirellulales bacterium]|nr:BBP7 family outer membrane beta-barrel protein [Pirellulales bacterium]